LRARHPVFRRRRFFEGERVRGNGHHDIAWHTPAGSLMDDHDWQVGYARSLTVFLNGQGISTLGPRGEQVIDDDFVLMFNANAEPMPFTMPDDLRTGVWKRTVDTGSGVVATGAAARLIDVTVPVTVPGFGVVVLRRPLTR
jgi:glycogen operon protein